MQTENKKKTRGRPGNKAAYTYIVMKACLLLYKCTLVPRLLRPGKGPEDKTNVGITFCLPCPFKDLGSVYLSSGRKRNTAGLALGLLM